MLRGAASAGAADMAGTAGLLRADAVPRLRTVRRRRPMVVIPVGPAVIPVAQVVIPVAQVDIPVAQVDIPVVIPVVPRAPAVPRVPPKATDRPSQSGIRSNTRRSPAQCRAFCWAFSLPLLPRNLRFAADTADTFRMVGAYSLSEAAAQ
jgi:hypothetical protein